MAKKNLGKENAKTSLSNIYLIFYNVLQVFGWSILLIQTINHICSHGFDARGLWKETHIVLKIFQTLAMLEVVHILIGIVKSGALATFFQISSRVFIVWAICEQVHDARISIGLILCLITWGITEVTRYLFYFLNIINAVPSILTYLRYTMFIVLYPMGVTGEQLCLYAALPYFQATNFLSFKLPLDLTFNFYYFVILVMFSYIPIFPQLYLHMFSQRKKYLGAKSTKGSGKKKHN